ncbi:MAG: hypothetical protein UMU75_09000 [Halomonas sp.]|nr:hypothetical protein [Halomonas sp.]
MSEKNPTAGHETSDVPARIPVLFILFMALFVPICLFALWLLIASVWKDVPYPPNPFAGQPVPADIPEVPQLQAAPKADLAAFEQRMEERLHGVGWVDREAGRVYMPIDRAMDLLVERGLPEQGAHASEARDIADPSEGAEGGMAVTNAVDISAAEVIVSPGEAGQPSDTQEAGHE